MNPDRTEPSAPDPFQKSEDEVFEEYLERINTGGPLDLEELRRLYPEFAERLIVELEIYESIGEGVEGNFRAGEPLGILGDYTLRRQIGRGGMGVVYEAWQNSMNRRVALKVLPAGVAVDRKASARFMREAQAAGQLNHPNVVHVHALGIEENTPYYAMEFIDGETLAQIITRWKATPAAATPFGSSREELAFYSNLAKAFADVAEGLQHAHSKGIIHRDIKPSNLILDGDGQLRILDFGLARLEGQKSLTLTGEFLGTPLYMSPEQARRKKIPVDHRTDIYSLGTTFYELLTLEPPFQGKDHQDTLSQIIEREPVEPRKLNNRMPKDLETIVLKCLRKEPVDRYGTAEALAQDLRRFVRGDPIEARPRTGWERLSSRMWRYRWRGAALVAAVLLLTSSGLLLRMYTLEAQRNAYDLYRTKVLGSCINLQMAQTVIQAQSGKTLSFDPWHTFTTGSNQAKGDGGGLDPLARAVAEAEEAIRILPRKPDAYYRKAKALVLLGREEEALEALDLASRADSEFVPGAALWAVLLERRGDQVGALRQMDRARRFGDSAWAAAWHSAYRAEVEKRWEEAAKSYGELIRIEGRGKERTLGSSLEARLGRGAARLESKKYVEAIDDFSAEMEHWPDLVVPALLKGKAYFLMGDETAAEQIFMEAYQQAVFSEEVAQVLVLLYAGGFGRNIWLGDKNYEKALRWVDFLKPGLKRETLRSACLRRLGRFRDSEAVARKAIELDEKSAEAFAELGTTLLREHRLGEAADAARKAIALDLLNPVSHFRLGMVLGAQGEWNKAVEEHREAIRLDPSYSAAHEGLADALLAMGKLQEAQGEAEIARKLTPTLSDAYVTAGLALAELGRYEEAEDLYKEAIDLDPENPDADAYVHWGELLESQGKLDEALEKCREGARRGLPRFPGWSQTSVARVLEKQGRSEEAFLQYCRAIDLDPGYLPPHSALPALLSKLKGSPAAEGALEKLVEPLERILGQGEEYLGQVMVDQAFGWTWKTRASCEGAICQTLALARLYGGKKRDTAAALKHIKRALEKDRGGDPDALYALADAQFALGQKVEAVLTLEEAAASPEARRYIGVELEAFRRSLLPDHASYASIDAAVDSLMPEEGAGRQLLDTFRAVAAGPDATKREAYLEACILDQVGRPSEAAKRLQELVSIEGKRPEPVLRLAKVLRRAREPNAAERATPGRRAGWSPFPRSVGPMGRGILCRPGAVAGGSSGGLSLRGRRRPWCGPALAPRKAQCR
jgi:serine/threonine protein kinase/tetratricopeptide (TPR) repeat protein